MFYFENTRVVVTTPLPSDEGMVEDHGAPKAPKIRKLSKVLIIGFDHQSFHYPVEVIDQIFIVAGQKRKRRE